MGYHLIIVLSGVVPLQTRRQAKVADGVKV